MANVGCQLPDAKNRSLETSHTKYSDIVKSLGSLESKLAGEPGNPEIMAKLAEQHLAMGRPDKAMALATQWLNQQGTQPVALKILYDTSLAMNRIRDAKSAINQALGLNFDRAPLMLDLARCFEADGRDGEALIIYRHLVDRVPLSSPHRPVAVARFAMLDESGTVAQYQEEIAALSKRDNVHPFHRALLHQAMAKYAEDCGDLDRAFENFLAAGAVASEASRPETLNDQLVNSFGKYIEATKSGSKGPIGSNSNRPIFVFGMHRSGTTLTEQILSSHPNVYGAGELPFFEIASSWFSPGDLDKPELSSLAESYLQLLNSYSDAAIRVVDKKPDNFKNLWLMAAAFPNAYYVHCRRNALDTCVSCLRRPISKAYRKDLTSIGEYYVNQVTLTEIWKGALPIPIYELDYERLVANPENEIRSLIAHVGLEWDDACLSPHDNRRGIHTPSRSQVSQPINDSSIGTWRTYEPYIGPLKKVLEKATPSYVHS
ncbi:MAG: sulfotransferase [Pseudomonadota bacterium]